MKLLLKQRFFSWFDSYDVYYEDGSVAFKVKGEPAWGHLLRIFDALGSYLATVKEKIFTFMPQFEIFYGDEYVGNIHKELTFLNQNSILILTAGMLRDILWNGIMKSMTDTIILLPTSTRK